MGIFSRRRLTACIAVLAVAGAGAATLAITAADGAAAHPSHVAVSLTRIPGNRCCAGLSRASVSASGVLTTATAPRSGHWRRRAQRTLSRAELRDLRAELRRFDPATLRGKRAACHGLPVGDVGGNELRVDGHESNCPPAGAQPLVRLLSRYLPKG